MFYRRLYGVPTWRTRNVFQEFDTMRRMMENLFGQERSAFQRPSTGVFPQINLTESKENYFIRAELPGVKADELDIQATGKTVSIAGERKIATEGQDARYHRKEREAGTFSRIIDLPDQINTNDVSAKLENGVLTVVVPKAEDAKPRQIQVK